jgi:glycosyltransferase involved in cell wall biosynthesis
MRPAHILVITSGHLSANPRPLKEAGALGRAGYDVTVLLVRNHAASELQDQDLMPAAPFRRVAVDAIAGHGTPAWRLFLRRGLASAGRKASAVLRLQSAMALGSSGLLLDRARGIPADLTIVHNEAPHWVGTQLMAQGRRIAADIEDWHSEDLLPEDRARRPLVLIRSVERRLLRHAAYTSTTSRALADALHDRYGGTRPCVITNSFPLQADPRQGPTGRPPSFFWFSQTLGPGRGLELFLAAWAGTARPSRLVLLGEPNPGFRERILGRLPTGHRQRVEFLPLVPPARLPSVIAQHDIGLALEQPLIVNRDLTITNKILQYLNAGIGVVASDTAGQREVLAAAPDAGLMATLSQTTELAARLDALIGDPERMAAMGRAARRAAETTYCWEKEEPKLLAAVDAALRQPAAPAP